MLRRPPAMRANQQALSSPWLASIFMLKSTFRREEVTALARPLLRPITMSVDALPDCGWFRRSDCDRHGDSMDCRAVRPPARGAPLSLSDWRNPIRQRGCRRGHRVSVDPAGGVARIRRRFRLDALEAISTVPTLPARRFV